MRRRGQRRARDGNDLAEHPWHLTLISHMCSLKRNGPRLFVCFFGTVWQYYSIWVRHFRRSYGEKHEMFPGKRREEEILGKKGIMLQAFGCSVCVCVWVILVLLGHHMIKHTWSTRAPLLRLNDPARGVKNMDEEEERQRSVRVNQGLSFERIGDKKCARRGARLDHISVS